MSQNDESQHIGTSNLRKEDEGFLAVKKYDVNKFTLIDGETYEGAIALYKGKVYTDIMPASFDEITETHFRKWLSLKPEMILIGTGSSHFFLKPEQVAYFYAKGVGIETMRTDSACRTYSVIAGEMRNGLAILFPIME